MVKIWSRNKFAKSGVFVCQNFFKHFINFVQYIINICTQICSPKKFLERIYFSFKKALTAAMAFVSDKNVKLVNGRFGVLNDKTLFFSEFKNFS